jgi:hypothetical protein
MVGNGVVIGLAPSEVRGMIPRDAFAVFEAWQAAHSPPKPGAEAMTAEEYRELVRRVDGDNSRAA